MKTQTSPSVKICGITQIEQALEIASLGVEAIGVIGVESSPRFLCEGKRRKLFNELIKHTPSTKRVWVVANLDIKEIEEGIKGRGTPSVVQLHGSESTKLCEELKKSYPDIQWWKAFQIRKEADLLLAETYQSSLDAILLDAWSRNISGGTGKRLPIKWLENINYKIPWWLAGGVSDSSIDEILSKTQPSGIDASSKLEIEPGIKDIKKVKALLNKLKSPR